MRVEVLITRETTEYVSIEVELPPDLQGDEVKWAWLEGQVPELVKGQRWNLSDPGSSEDPTLCDWWEVDA